ncbi:MAG: VCBS repeat-containing protein [Nitrospirae bacterium]|nr:VCBS repeat-containing protein [Nitrospirota bacterium]
MQYSLHRELLGRYYIWVTPGTVTITVSADGYNSSSFTEDISPYETVTENISLTPVATQQYTLTASKSGTGSGTVTSSDGLINCGSDCSEIYNSGTSVTLTATDTCSTFGGWSGCDSTTDNTCTIAMNAAKSVTATFTLNPTNKHDFNCDGKPDILFQNESTGQLQAWFMDGATQIGSGYLSPDNPGNVDWKVVGIDDFNGDGKGDILFRYEGTGDLVVWYMDGTTETDWSFLTPPTPGDTNWKVTGIGDFNSDGKPDILWQHQSTGKLMVWYMDGVTRSSYAYPNPDNPGDTDWRVTGVDDFNSDGKPDILWQHQSTGQLAVWYMNGIKRSNSTYLSPDNPGDINWKVVGIDDFNSDGKPDILWQHHSTGQLAVWYMDGVTRRGINSLWYLAAVLDPVGFSSPRHYGYENAACSFMNSIGLRYDGYFGAQSLHLRCGSIPPASRSTQSVAQLHGGLGVGLVVSLCPSWTYTSKN